MEFFLRNSQQLKAKMLHHRCLKELEISPCTTALKNNEVHPKKIRDGVLSDKVANLIFYGKPLNEYFHS